MPRKNEYARILEMSLLQTTRTLLQKNLQTLVPHWESAEIFLALLEMNLMSESEIQELEKILSRALAETIQESRLKQLENAQSLFEAIRKKERSEM